MSQPATVTNTLLRPSTISVLLLAMVLAPVAPIAAKLLLPASQALRGEHHQIMEATVVAIPAADRVTLRRERKLYGHPAAAVTVRLEPRSVAALEVGQRCLIAYSDWYKVRFPGRSGKDPEGPQVLRVPGVGQALFAPSRVARRLLTQSSELDDQALLDLLIKGLKQADPATQRLFIADLMPRRQLHAALGERRLAALAAFGSDPHVDPEAREYLLATAQRPPHSLGASWWSRSARHLLRSSELDLDPISPRPQLIRTALRALPRHPEVEDFDLAARWLHSPHGGLVRGAVKALGALDRRRLAAAIERALASADLPATSRAVLRQHQQTQGAAESPPPSAGRLPVLPLLKPALQG